MINLLCSRCKKNPQYTVNSHYCRPCKAAYTREYNAAKREQVNAYYREHRNKPEVKQRLKDQRIEAKDKLEIRRIAKDKVARGLVKKSEICAICSQPKRVEMHHFDYEHWSHFIWVCKQCHEKEHHP